MDKLKFRAWLKFAKLKQQAGYADYMRRNSARLRREWGEIFDLPDRRPLPEPKCADLYLVGDDLGKTVDDIYYASDKSHCQPHASNEALPPYILTRPRLILKKIRDVVDANDPNNTGWIELELSGKNPAGLELRETLLWHDGNAEYRARVVTAVETMTLELAFPSER